MRKITFTGAAALGLLALGVVVVSAPASAKVANATFARAQNLLVAMVARDDVVLTARSGNLLVASAEGSGVDVRANARMVA